MGFFFFCHGVFFPPYACSLQVGNRLGFWGGFSCFVSFIWCQLLAWLIRAAVFRLPPAFVVWSFFLCHRHLWPVLSFSATGICVWSLSFTAFSAVGIRARLFVFAKSAHLNCTHLTHLRLTAGQFHRNLCIVMLWVACELLQFAAIQ